MIFIFLIKILINLLTRQNISLQKRIYLNEARTWNVYTFVFLIAIIYESCAIAHTLKRCFLFFFLLRTNSSSNEIAQHTAHPKPQSTCIVYEMACVDIKEHKPHSEWIGTHIVYWGYCICDGSLWADLCSGIKIWFMFIYGHFACICVGILAYISEYIVYIGLERWIQFQFN